MDSIGNKGRPGRIVLLFFLYLSFQWILPGCSLLRNYFKEVETVVIHDTKDSIIIRDRVIHDTLRVPVPVYVEKNVTQDDSSHLENPFAVSDAWVKDGLLHHSLRTRGQMEVPVEIPVSDTTAIHNENSTETHNETVYVEKELSPIQKAKINSFWWLLLGLVAALAWISRKPILKLIKLL